MYLGLTICGRAGNEPELKYTDKGIAYTRISVACDSGVKNEPVWVSVTVFGKSAEFVAQYVKKGRSVLCDGKPSFSAYIAKDGTAKPDVKLVANNIRIVDSQKNSSDGQKDCPF